MIQVFPADAAKSREAVPDQAQFSTLTQAWAYASANQVPEATST